MRGSVRLPADLKTGRRFHGYWRIENGVLPIQAANTRNDTVVVIEGPKGTAPAAKTVTVDISGLAPSPATVIVPEGSVVEFKNSDRVAHDLSIPDQVRLMPLERLGPGGVRRQKFPAAGGYAVRSARYPHLVISVVVVTTPYFATLENGGSFKIADVPDGKATLKVWSQGRWIHEEEIEVGPKSGDLQLKVGTSAAARTDGE